MSAEGLVFQDANSEQLVETTGSHQAAFDALACHLVETAVVRGYIPDREECRDVAELLTKISEVACERDDKETDDLVGVAAELWADKRTHKTFSFGVEVVKRDGRYIIWRPQ